MDDFERYGDYNEIDEPPAKRGRLDIVKILAIVACFSVMLVVGLRLFTFNYYPDSIKNIHFTERLTEYYSETNGGIGALTQKIRAPYDNATEGNFFCANLVVIPEIGELQLSVRYNESLAYDMVEKYKLESFDVDNTEQFTFRLWRDGVGESSDGYAVGSLVYQHWESFAMYRYCRLVFDGIDFSDGDDKIEWLRLEIFVDGVENPFMVAVYENNDEYSDFKNYKISRAERP